MTSKAGRVVFVGNIPYGLTEEQIIEQFSQCGQVLNFRLVHDKETGKPKGYGFVEYSDADSAASAVRNLNDRDVQGRKLRVDYSNDGGAGDNAPAGYAAPPSQPQQHQQYQPVMPSHVMPNQQRQPQHSLPALPQGTELPPNVLVGDAISATMRAIPTHSLLDLLVQMKELVQSEPAKSTELLRRAPQLAYALFQALLLLGLVELSAIHNLVTSTLQQQVVPPPPPSQMQPPQQYLLPQQQQQQQQQLTQQYPIYTQYPPPPHLHHMAPRPGPTPPLPTQRYMPPTAFQQPQSPAPLQQFQAPAPPQNDQTALMDTLAAMPQRQVDALDPASRNQIMAIREQLRARGYTIAF